MFNFVFYQKYIYEGCTYRAVDNRDLADSLNLYI